jgi:hypothetical protein
MRGLTRTLEQALQHAAARSVRVRRIVHRIHQNRWRRYSPDWAALISRSPRVWRDARQAAKNGPAVLIATLAGGHPAVPIMDSLLAASLTLRGANVHFLLCDSLLPACHMAEFRLMEAQEFVRKGPQRFFCTGCFQHAASMYEPLGLPVHRFSDHITHDQMKEADNLLAGESGDVGSHVRQGIPVGEHAVAGALRYFARADLGGEPSADDVLRRYLKAAHLTDFVMRNLLDANSFVAVCVQQGLYVPQGIVAEVARAKGCRVAAWHVAYRNRSFVFSHGETYHHTLMSEPTTTWEDMKWSEEHEQQIMDYLHSRRRSGRDWIAFQDKHPEEDLSSILRDLGVDPSRPVIGMLTNVAWDAQLHYPANAFPDMLDWVTKTIAYFAKRPDLQLVIRVHPAEITGDISSRQPVVEEIARAFPIVPKNVFVIPPQSRTSTYAVMEACDSVIIYGTKTGVELTSLGVPVIVAGEAWIRNKGITRDAASAEDYFRILDELPIGRRMSEDVTARARKYAYHFFFRRMIPVLQVSPTGRRRTQFRVDIETLDDLLPGRSRGLDVICDGILTGSPFIYPAEDERASDGELR